MKARKIALALGMSLMLTSLPAGMVFAQEEAQVQPEEGTAAYYYQQGDTLKNQDQDYEAALQAFVQGAACEETEESREAIGNCLVQIGECCVRLQHGPEGETGSALAEYVLECWERAGSLGASTGYFDIALAYIGLDIPGAGDGSILGLPTGFEAQETGVEYLYKALDLNNGKAQRYIGMCYWNGYGVEQSYEKAYELFSTTKGADLYIAYMKLYGFGGVEENLEEALELLTAKAESLSGGNRSEARTSREVLAELFYTGSVSMTLYDGTVVTAEIEETDPEKALTYIGYNKDEFGLSEEDVEAILAGYEQKIAGQSSEAETEESAETAESTSVADTLATYDLTVEDVAFVANILKQYNEGNSNLGLTEEDYYDTELKLAKLGADMGSGELALWVGEIYQGGHVEGLSEAEAVETAIEWWNRAAELGQSRGWTNIGLLYEHSSIPGGGQNFGDIEYDQDKAVEYLTRADAAGDTKAPRYLGFLYEAAEDYENALTYFLKACDLGDITAFYYTGLYYLVGRGTEADYEKALEYLSKAASSEKVVPGVADAQFSLGSMYENGLGVDADPEKAAEWYQAAADNGNENAVAALERLAQ